jgi:mannose-6-phosphate isomerase-like protein (cupin superfamily)
MKYLRRFAPELLDPTAFDHQVLADLESCLVVICNSPEGATGPSRHVHECDQLYYVLQGAMEIKLGDETQIVESGSLVFIPRGTPHHNRNAGTTAEMHLDVLVPPPARGRALSRPAVPTDKASGAHYVHRVGSSSYRPSHVPGFDLATVASPSTGSQHILIKMASVQPSSPGTSWHIHRFDQLYWVLEGTLTVEVANEHYDVAPGNLVVLPAGVPHRNWNSGDTVERHIAFLVPPPDGPHADLSVTFAVEAPVTS